MILETVNLTTGPVAITANVRNALAELPVSHRSLEFKKLYSHTTVFLCEQLNVNHCFLFTGSGTVANETMIQQVKATSTKGLILSNGEFGNRLIDQGKRNQLEFRTYMVNWGEEFDLSVVEKLVRTEDVEWLLFCHCETSTGIINDLPQLARIAKENNCGCYVDCMSTTGTADLDLSQVTMATASSGKGLACIPGLAIVFSNVDPLPCKSSPIYLDLAYYDSKNGIPFTLSSNLLKALNVSITEKLQKSQLELIKEYRKKFYHILNESLSIPFSSTKSAVFTIVNPPAGFIKHLEKRNILLSHQSYYLEQRGWYQLGTFGFYTESALAYVAKTLQKIAEPVSTNPALVAGSGY